MHWAIVIAVAIMLFGATPLPESARALGRSVRILKSELSPTTPAGHTHNPVGGAPGGREPTPPAGE